LRNGNSKLSGNVIRDLSDFPRWRWSMKERHEIQADFQGALKAFYESNEDRIKLVVENRGRYLVLHRDRSWSVFRLEVSAGRQLPEGFGWTPEQEQVLYDLGLRQGRASNNYRAQIQNAAQWEDQWVDGLEQVVYQLLNDEEGEPVWTVREEKEEHVQSEGIVEGMNHLANTRTWQARTRLYRLLLASRLLVLVSGKGNGQRVEFGQVGTMGNWGVTAAFTSYEVLDAYEPRGAEVLALPGDVLFPELSVARIGALKLNPGSAPTGELYANEIKIIVDGLKKLSGVH
jgi:hypothetical protein